MAGAGATPRPAGGRCEGWSSSGAWRGQGTMSDAGLRAVADDESTPLSSDDVMAEIAELLGRRLHLVPLNDPRRLALVKLYRACSADPQPHPRTRPHAA